jgi:hypothetical protein
VSAARRDRNRGGDQGKTDRDGRPFSGLGRRRQRRAVASLPAERRAVKRTALRRASAGSQAGRSGTPLSWPWLQITNVWRKRTSRAGGPRRLRGMTTILRKYHFVARCTLLGEMIEDTAHRYYYRPHVGGELTFVDKSPSIHLTPCPACPDWPASQQRGSAVGTNSR